MNIALIADSHLAERAPECVANWRAAARAVEVAEPDLTIHLGDISLDGEREPDELSFAAQFVRTWPTPMCCLLGNHDMGSGSGEESLCEQALGRCIDTFGADRWAMTVGDWALVGLNAQLLGTGTAQEKDQRDWVQRFASRLTKDDRVALFLHRPVHRHPRDVGMPGGRYVSAESARWLLTGPLQHALRVVVSGHTHQALDFVADDVRHLWVPSASFVISDALQTPVGQKTVGLGWLSLRSEEVEYMWDTPAGSKMYELTRLGFYRESHA
jgi:3',5'-cyclic AMP phosphodiesterase CpdA